MADAEDEVTVRSNPEPCIHLAGALHCAGADWLLQMNAPPKMDCEVRSSPAWHLLRDELPCPGCSPPAHTPSVHLYPGLLHSKFCKSPSRNRQVALDRHDRYMHHASR
jgi:hypothetical protein